jgi:AAA domain
VERLARTKLQLLRVSGTGRPDADIEFGPGLTLITGKSDTGKSHVLECLDYALGAGSPPEAIPEREGYQRVALELERDGAPISVIRNFDSDLATIFPGALSDWDEVSGDVVKIHISAGPDPLKTLSGQLLALSKFDVDAPVVSNQRGKSQRLSFRTFAPLAIISEGDVISDNSPVVPPQVAQQTASRSVFQIMLTGNAPSREEVAAIKAANDRREAASQRVDAVDPLIEELREEIANADYERGDLERELQRIEQELAEVSEAVSQSGNRARSMMIERNRALAVIDKAERRHIESRELQARFELLSEHYSTDVQRLEFVIEGGHFFQQIAATHCPSCGRPIDSEAECHPESAEFEKIEKAARAEIAKLAPRMGDLDKAIADAGEAQELASSEAERARKEAARLDIEIEEVANPSAKAARSRVATITARRHTLEDQLLRFRELDRYLAVKQEAAMLAGEAIERYRPEQDLPSLLSLSEKIKELLVAWKFPLKSDLYFSTETDDLVIDGKERSAYGKGARAITHAAFTVGLMRHCLSANTPHPGFVVIDTPLRPFSGISDDVHDPTLTRDVHRALLYSLTTLNGGGQSIIIENIPPPEVIEGRAVIHQFVGSDGAGRKGFYPVD